MPVLVFPDDSLPYHGKADSSDTATRAVLSQQSSEDGGKWHPITFFSKSLSLVEQNYEIHDKDMLAIIQALEEWWHFLEGTPVRAVSFLVVFWEEVVMLSAKGR